MQAFELVAGGVECAQLEGVLHVRIRDLFVIVANLFGHAESLYRMFCLPLLCFIWIKGDLFDNRSHPFLAQKNIKTLKKLRWKGTWI